MIHRAVFHSSDGVYEIISSLTVWAHLVPQTGTGSYKAFWAEGLHSPNSSVEALAPM